MWETNIAIDLTHNEFQLDYRHILTQWADMIYDTNVL